MELIVECRLYLFGSSALYLIIDCCLNCSRRSINFVGGGLLLFGEVGRCTQHAGHASWHRHGVTFS